MIDFACKRFDLREIVKCGLGLTRADLQVFEYLLRHGESCSSESVAKRLDLDLSTVQRSTKRLYEKGIVKRMQINLAGGGYIFEYEAQERRVIRKIVLDVVHRWTARVEDELQHWG